MNVTFKKLVVVGILTLGSVSSNAVTIDFENYLSGSQITNGYSGANVTSYYEDGFTLSSSTDSSVYHNDIFNGNNGEHTNGTDIFGWCGTLCQSQPTTISLTDGGTFTLASIDLSNFIFGLDSGTIDVVGTFLNGSTITQEVDTVLDSWTTFNFNGFENITGLSFIGEGHVRFYALDNIVLSSVQVSEPATLSLLGLGLVGLVLTRRQKKPLYYI